MQWRLEQNSPVEACWDYDEVKEVVLTVESSVALIGGPQRVLVLSLRPWAACATQLSSEN